MCVSIHLTANNNNDDDDDFKLPSSSYHRHHHCYFDSRCMNWLCKAFKPNFSLWFYIIANMSREVSNMHFMHVRLNHYRLQREMTINTKYVRREQIIDVQKQTKQHFKRKKNNNNKKFDKNLWFFFFFLIILISHFFIQL